MIRVYFTNGNCVVDDEGILVEDGGDPTDRESSTEGVYDTETNIMTPWADVVASTKAGKKVAVGKYLDVDGRLHFEAITKVRYKEG